MGEGGADLRALSKRLKEAGKEGRGLRRALDRQLKEVAEDFAKKVADPANLEAHMPNRYAAVLGADLGVKIRKSLAGDPAVTIRAQARAHARKLKYLDDGFINHPVYARGPRRPGRPLPGGGRSKGWRWKNGQTGGMRAGFFSGVAKEDQPEIRDKVMQALISTARSISID